MTHKLALASCLICVLTVAGCLRHQPTGFKWRAEDYFGDQQTIELCDAIEDGDEHKVKELLSSGANINDRGKDGMTPLLWAFAGGSAEIFQLLLDAGADPTVPTKSDFGTRGRIGAGWTVAHLASKGEDEEKFRAVLNAEIDPDLKCFPPNRPNGIDLFWAVLEFDNRMTFDRPRSLRTVYARTKELLALRPSQETLDKAARAAIGCENFETALLLFESGAKHKTPYTQWGSTIHNVAKNRVEMGSHSYEGYVKLVAWLESKGEDVAAARADWERWQADLGIDPSEAAKRRKHEIRLRAKKEGNTVDF